jgi:hypothetical protein
MIRRVIRSRTVRELAAAVGIAAGVLGLGAATANAAPAAPPAAVALAARAAPAVAPPCAAGYSPITNQAGGAIIGQGVNNPVELNQPGNCWHAENPFTFMGLTGYEYVNGSNHCLWVNGTTLEVGANDCVAGHVNEGIIGAQYIAGQGWGLLSEATQNWLQPVNCGLPNTFVTSQANVGACPRFQV